MEPAHTGPPFVGEGVVGIAFTVAVVTPAALVQLLTVTVTAYCPDAAVVAFVIDGVLNEDVKLLGPVQL